MDTSASSRRQLGTAIALTFLAFMIAILLVDASEHRDQSDPVGLINCGTGFDIQCDPRYLN